MDHVYCSNCTLQQRFNSREKNCNKFIRVPNKTHTLIIPVFQICIFSMGIQIHIQTLAETIGYFQNSRFTQLGCILTATQGRKMKEKEVLWISIFLMTIRIGFSIFMPIRIRILPQVLHKARKAKNLFIFFCSNASLHRFHKYEIVWKKSIVVPYIWLKGIQIRIRLRIRIPADADLMPI
jgi:hypothetical protein